LSPAASGSRSNRPPLGQPAQIAQAFGARRYAHNWALAQVKANLDARKADPAVPLLAWDADALPKQWNHAKHQVAPWWRACSKEAFSSGSPTWSRAS
jgi:putative transposase